MKDTRIKRFNENSELNISDVSDSFRKKLINFIKDLFTEPKCEFCGKDKENVGGGGLSNEPLYVCLNKKCELNYH
jgi:hypothetical protein